MHFYLHHNACYLLLSNLDNLKEKNEIYFILDIGES